MVKFKLNFMSGKFKIEIVDDAEGTPGASRQYTRFRQNKEKFEKAWNDNRDISLETAANALKKVLAEENFKVVKLERNEKSPIAMFYIESTEG